MPIGCFLLSGDTWNESLGFWGKGGPSNQNPARPTDPMLIGYYGYYTDPSDPFDDPVYSTRPIIPPTPAS